LLLPFDASNGGEPNVYNLLCFRTTRMCISCRKCPISCTLCLARTRRPCYRCLSNCCLISSSCW